MLCHWYKDPRLWRIEEYHSVHSVFHNRLTDRLYLALPYPELFHGVHQSVCHLLTVSFCDSHPDTGLHYERGSSCAVETVCQCRFQYGARRMYPHKVYIHPARQRHKCVLAQLIDPDLWNLRQIDVACMDIYHEICP